MQRLLDWLGGTAGRSRHPGFPGKIAWRPTLLAASVAVAALAVYEAFKYFAS